MKTKNVIFFLIIILWGINLQADLTVYYLDVKVHLKNGKIYRGLMNSGYENINTKHFDYLKKHPGLFTAEFIRYKKEVLSPETNKKYSYFELYRKGFIWKLNTFGEVYNVMVPNGAFDKVPLDQIQKLEIQSYYPISGNDVFELISPLYQTDNWQEQKPEEILINTKEGLDEISQLYIFNYSEKKVDPKLIKKIKKLGLKIKKDQPFLNKLRKNKLILVLILSN